MVIPVAFKIEEPEPEKPYILVEKDTVYTSPTKAAKFMGGPDALTKYIKEKTPKLKQLDDSCSVGVVQYSIIIRPNRTVKIVDTYDFNSLGFDAQFEGITLINAAASKWEAGEFNGIKVNTTENIRIKFQPNAKKCPNALKNFDAAAKISEEGLKQIDANQSEKALELLDKAVALDPKNTEIRYQRGLLEVNMKKNTAACEDLTFVKKNLKVNWADMVMKFVCNK
jgi:tetratricopeptide (TPR) repeat protein